MRYYIDTEFIERPLCRELVTRVVHHGVESDSSAGRATTSRKVVEETTAGFILLPTIDLLSLAIVREDGKELYVLHSDCKQEYANDFVQKNVIPNLAHPASPTDPTYAGRLTASGTRVEIARLVRGFIGEDQKPVFYGYYADYDWVVFCWLFGSMMDLPNGFPYYCRDLKQTVDEIQESTGIDLRAQLPLNDAHNALVDARFVKTLHEHLLAYSSGQLA